MSCVPRVYYMYTPLFVYHKVYRRKWCVSSMFNTAPPYNTTMQATQAPKGKNVTMKGRWDVTLGVNVNVQN